MSTDKALGPIRVDQLFSDCYNTFNRTGKTPSQLAERLDVFRRDLEWALTWINNEAKHLRKRGHPFSQDNTHIDTKGKRVCKTCRNEKRWNEAARAKGRERYHRRKAKAEQHEPS